MRRRTFLQTLAMAVVVPWTRLLAPAVREPVLSELDAGWACIVHWEWRKLDEGPQPVALLTSIGQIPPSNSDAVKEFRYALL